MDDDDGIIFPWEDVEKSRQSKSLQKHEEHSRADALRKFGDVRCPSCGKTAEKLACFFFKSPKWTWRRLCGRAGWMVVCDECHRQVKFNLSYLS